jgi:hypothetical protein
METIPSNSGNRFREGMRLIDALQVQHDRGEISRLTMITRRAEIVRQYGEVAQDGTVNLGPYGCRLTREAQAPGGA